MDICFLTSHEIINMECMVNINPECYRDPCFGFRSSASKNKGMIVTGIIPYNQQKR